jgi:hypothetical protein
MNKLKIIKRQISDRKFSRIFAQNLDKIGVASKTDRYGSTVNSAQAVKVGRYIYARFPCKEQTENRLNMYSCRYDEDFPLDMITFVSYPKPVIQKEEF